jgi:hypothetical protein
MTNLHISVSSASMQCCLPVLVESIYFGTVLQDQLHYLKKTFLVLQETMRNSFVRELLKD